VDFATGDGHHLIEADLHVYYASNSLGFGEVEMADCPKCRGAMTQGYAYIPDTGSRVKWRDGEPGFWNFISKFGKASELGARRCSKCGFVEFFADPTAKPVKTLSTLEEENDQLRRLVTKLQDRVGTLETIATDPAERTAREIESLRDLPSPGDAAKNGRDQPKQEVPDGRL
jgi:predicted nucleic-acid-binding Zn-ribbon protein